MAEKREGGKGKARVRASAAGASKPKAGAARSSVSDKAVRGKPAAKAKSAGSKKVDPRGARPRAGRAATSKTASAAPARRKTSARSRTVPPASRPAGLTEEDQIRSAKYLPRDLPPRLFEEERFLFPESYGVNRIRLLVKDPEWLFVHWDVDPASVESLRKSLGERAMALSRMTLRVVDPTNGGSSDILLPPGARGWYIRADVARRSYKAELGVTLPSGEFRRLAESNLVVTPRVGPSRERATRRITFGQAARLPKEAGLGQRDEELRSVSGAGPWQGSSVDGAAEGGAPGAAATVAEAKADRPAKASRPGASDSFRPGGASDVYRR
jgi:Domain of unknown function (DUF4912)